MNKVDNRCEIDEITYIETKRPTGVTQMKTTKHTFEMTEHFAEIIHNSAKSNIATLHNHIASYLERNEIDKARALIKELRNQQAIFATFNMEANNYIAESSGEPVKTSHTVFLRS